MAHDGKRWRVFDPSPMPDGAVWMKGHPTMRVENLEINASFQIFEVQWIFLQIQGNSSGHIQVLREKYRKTWKMKMATEVEKVRLNRSEIRKSNHRYRDTILT